MSDRKIVYRDFESPHGPMIGGCTDRGVCFLEWHDRGGVERILQRVTKRYTMPVEAGNHQLLEQLSRELKAYFDGVLTDFEVPVDVIGTPFEMKVWDQLRRIAFGKTLTYGALAEMLGKPGASRAVGRANGANYLSIVIPCHRVIAGDGSLGGYGGKLWRKANLLRLEGVGLPTASLFV